MLKKSVFGYYFVLQPWNAFEESYGQLVKRSSEQVVNQSSFAEQYLYRESEVGPSCAFV